MITIKAIDILKEANKYQVREIHDGGRSGLVYENYGKPIFSEPQAILRARRHKVDIAHDVDYWGITEAAS